MKYPPVSIVIATFNSEKTLSKVLKSIEKQDYPHKKIETLVIDGGSRDRTLSIAKQYECRIFKNVKVDQVFAKYIGYKKAKGKYLLLLDSDEVLESVDSIKLKSTSMLKDNRVKVALSTGLKKPNGYPQINYYINEFGDPFSFFMYKISKDPKYFLKELKSQYKIVYEDKDRVVFDFSKSGNPPFIELTAMGVMISLEYVRSSYPKILKETSLHTHLFYLINRGNNLFAVMKNDSIVHYSVPTISGYLKKIKTRIRSNIFKTEMGKAGFAGREAYQTNWYGFKKAFFVLYSLSILLPILDSLFLYLKTRRSIYFIHPVLCVYTVSLIIFYYFLKVFRIKIKLSGYGI